jgi:hypothetical protein
MGPGGELISICLRHNPPIISLMYKLIGLLHISDGPFSQIQHHHTSLRILHDPQILRVIDQEVKHLLVVDFEVAHRQTAVR